MAAGRGIALNTLMYSSGFAWLPCRSLQDTIASVARLGFDGIEIAACAPHAYPPFVDAGQRRSIRKTVADAGLEISGICSCPGGAPGFNPASPDRPEREANLGYVTECLQLAHDLEAPLLVWLGGWTRYGQSHYEAFALTAESLRGAIEAAEPLGVRLAVEATSEISDVLENVGDTLRLLDAAEADPASAGALVDTLPVLFESDDPCAQFVEAGDRLIHVHLQDLEGDPAGTHTDFRSSLEQLTALDYEGWLTIETGYAKRVTDPDGEARRALAHITEVRAAAAG
ncbi:MAG TPA: sugar phosphate isomerase/epimerase [Solirubrobacteraceae bacterium]|jgi:protein FrlC